MSKVIRFVSTIVGFFCAQFGIAQSSEVWTTYRDMPAAKIEYTIHQCGSDVITEFYFLKLTNKTAQSIDISFKIEYYYNGSCSTCGTNEYQFTFTVPANGFLMPDCNLTSSEGRLAIIKRYVNRNYGHPLDRFELSNIIVQ
jgi:hypothetical protein